MKTKGWILPAALGIALTAGVALPLAAQESESKKDPTQIGSRDVGKGVNFYSLEKEIALGRQLSREVEREAQMVVDSVAVEYVNRLAQNLTRNSDSKVPVVARIIDSQQVNAFALPGGFLFVDSGLVVTAETEAELAAVMAHEIAHVAARHGTRQASRGQIANIASLPLIFLGGWAGFAARQAAGVAVPMAFLKFSRAFEEEADLLGLQYLDKAGYDPTAFIDFFERVETLEQKKPGTASELFRSHPDTASRIRNSQLNLQVLLKQPSQYVVTTSEFIEVKQRLMRAKRGPNAAPAKTGPTLRRPSERRDGDTVPDDERPTLRRRVPPDGPNSPIPLTPALGRARA